MENKRERRKPTEHDVVMAVIYTMGRFGVIAYGSLALCLVGIVIAGIFTGKWELAIVTALISSVAAGASAAAGFMAGVLSQTFKQPVLGTPEHPMPVTTPPGEPIETTSVDEAAPNIAANLPPTTGDTQPE